MSKLQVQGGDGDTVELEAKTVQAFAAGLRGPLLSEHSEDYDAARASGMR